MAHSLAFDLAARFSGAALVSDEHGVIATWAGDFGPATGDPLVNLLAARDWVRTVCEEVSRGAITAGNIMVTVENVSHFLTDPAPALRLQGMLLPLIADFGLLGHPLLVMPPVWQNGLGWSKTPETKFNSKTWAKWLAVFLGYDIENTPGSKAAEDVTDAVLIARWRLEMERQSASTDEGR